MEIMSRSGSPPILGASPELPFGSIFPIPPRQNAGFPGPGMIVQPIDIRLHHIMKNDFVT
jgi:hypothetical protein